MEAKSSKKLVPILPGDFNVAELIDLARQGRLFYDANIPCVKQSEADRIQLVRQYVSAIDRCASAKYSAIIADLWPEIVKDPGLNANLFIVKGRNKGSLNRYRILAIVTMLLEFGVYNSGQYTVLALHNLLENVDKKTSIYKSCLKYSLSNKERSSLKRLVISLINQ